VGISDRQERTPNTIWAALEPTYLSEWNRPADARGMEERVAFPELGLAFGVLGPLDDAMLLSSLTLGVRSA
jgi:hypothetical protein